MPLWSCTAPPRMGRLAADAGRSRSLAHDELEKDARTMRKKPNPSKVMLTFRVSADQHALLQAALKVHPEHYKGLSHFARELMLDWAAATLARKERAA
jgi:hypothetical protein